MTFDTEAPHPLSPQGLGGPVVNQGAITECLPLAPVLVCDSRQNPRLLVPEPSLREMGNTPTILPSLPPTPFYASQPLIAFGVAAEQPRAGAGIGALQH